MAMRLRTVTLLRVNGETKSGIGNACKGLRTKREGLRVNPDLRPRPVVSCAAKDDGLAPSVFPPDEDARAARTDFFRVKTAFYH